MGFPELDRHTAIAWDFDGTLVNHPKSPLIRTFIRARPNTRHVIVTFRSLGMQRSLWSELAGHQDAPPRDAFEAMINMSATGFTEHALAQATRRLRQGGPLGVPLGTAISEVERDYVEWKGKICHQHGLTALVDDLAHLVLPGCTRYGVAFFDPADL